MKLFKKVMAFAAVFAMAFTFCACSGGTKESEADAIKAPVIGYLDAIQDGDYKKAASYETSTSGGSNEMLDALDELDQELEEMGLGDAFNTEAMNFMDSFVKMVVKSYKLEEPEIDGDKATIKAVVTGISVDDVDYDTMMEDEGIEDVLFNYLMDNAEKIENGEISEEQAYGEMGKLLFDKMIEIIKQNPDEESDMTFTVEKQSDGAWKITSVD